MDQSHRDFDLTYRPDYWRPSDPISLIIANVNGEIRRRQILDVLEGRHRMVAPGTELPESLLQDSLSDGDRDAWGAVHPAMMRGEYLPDYSRGQMEIARIVLASATMEVVSVRAHRSQDLRIHYSVVDEYETSFSFQPKSSEAPLSFGEIVSLLDSIRSAHDPEGRPWIEWVRDFNYRGDPEQVAHFATVSSPLYRYLHAYYHWRNEQWLARERVRVASARQAGQPASTPDAPPSGEEAAR